MLDIDIDDFENTEFYKSDWVEFETKHSYDKNVFLNIKRSEIVAVKEITSNCTKIYLKNSESFDVILPYEKVMELV